LYLIIFILLTYTSCILIYTVPTITEFALSFKKFGNNETDIYNHRGVDLFAIGYLGHLLLPFAISLGIKTFLYFDTIKTTEIKEKQHDDSEINYLNLNVVTILMCYVSWLIYANFFTFIFYIFVTNKLYIICAISPMLLPGSLIINGIIFIIGLFIYLLIKLIVCIFKFTALFCKYIFKCLVADFEEYNKNKPKNIPDV